MDPFVFVSYGGRDSETKAFVKELIDSILEQDIDVWNYEDEFQKILTGKDIERECLRRLESASIIIGVISPSAFESEFASAEIARALEFPEERFFPLVLRDGDFGGNPKSWPNPFCGVARRKFEKIDSKQPEDLSRFLENDLCPALGKEYRKQQTDRVALAERVRLTLGDRKGVKPEYDAGDYGDCKRKARDAERAYYNERLGECLGYIGELIDLINEKYGVSDDDDALYYPFVLNSVITAEAAGHAPETVRSQIDSLIQASERFANCLDNEIFSAIGLQYWSVGEHEAACDAFARAYEIYQTNAQKTRLFDETTEADLIFNLLKATMKSPRNWNRSALFKRYYEFAPEKVQKSHEDIVRFTVERAFESIRQGDYEGGFARFNEIVEAGPVADDLVITLCSALREALFLFPQPRLLEMIHRTLIQAFMRDGEVRPDIAPEHLYFAAERCVELAEYDTAKTFYHALNLRGSRPQFLIDAAKLHLALGEVDTCRELSRRVLSSDVRDQVVKDHSYYLGFAKFFLKVKGFETNFEDSGYPPEKSYKSVRAKYLSLFRDGKGF